MESVEAVRLQVSTATGGYASCTNLTRAGRNNTLLTALQIARTNYSFAGGGKATKSAFNMDNMH